MAQEGKSRATFHEDFTLGDKRAASSDRAFGFVFAGVFTILGIFPALRGGDARAWALGTAAVFLFLALFASTVLHPLNRVWLKFGAVLHRISSSLIMGVVFFAVITPMALFMKLIRRDTMKRRFDPMERTYWIVRSSTGTDPAGMRHEF